MAGKIAFTNTALTAIPAPTDGKQATWWDTRTPGLCLLVTPKGAKTFYVYRKVDGRPVRHKLGRFPDMTTDMARKAAAVALGEMAQGKDPRAEAKRLRAESTFGDLFTWYMVNHAKPRKRSWADDQAQYDRYLTGLGRRRLSDISRGDVRELHARIGKDHGPYSANRALALIRAVWNKGEAGEMTALPNPTKGVQAFREERRERYLNDDELSRFMQALADEPSQDTRDLLLIALFTGARRSNVLEMAWRDVDLTEAVWRIPMTKNGKPQRVPLLPTPRAVLSRRSADIQGPWVFPGRGKTGHLAEPRKGLERVCRRAGIDNLRIHDLRHTTASLMVNAGVPLAIIGKALHHETQATTAGYAHVAMDPVRDGMGQGLGKASDLAEQFGLVDLPGKSL